MHTWFLSPSGPKVGLTTLSLGLIRVLDRHGVRVGFFKPVARDKNHSWRLANDCLGLGVPKPISFAQARQDFHADESVFLEGILERFQSVKENTDVVIVEGVVSDNSEYNAERMNAAIARALGADVLLVAAPGEEAPAQFAQSLNQIHKALGGVERVLGALINKVGAPAAENTLSLGYSRFGKEQGSDQISADYCEHIHGLAIPVLACVPWQRGLGAPRTRDVAEYYPTHIIHEGDWEKRRVSQVMVCARTVPNMIFALAPGVLVITPGDRVDVILATCMSALNGVPLAGLLLTGELPPDDGVLKLCATALNTGLPVLQAADDTYTTALRLSQYDTELPADDRKRVEQVMDYVAGHMDSTRLLNLLSLPSTPHLSPAAFRYRLVKQAASNPKRIILPEGEEPRVLQAAIACQERGIAHCVLLGDPQHIDAKLQAAGLNMPEGLEVLDPVEIRQRYIRPLVEKRQHKGMTPPLAAEQLSDNVVLATMMLALDEVDGLVAGATHTTANTIRPAFQLIKTSEQARLVSSVFFMCLPDQVLVYGDCAVNPDPNAEELADIALQSARSAKQFGIEPRVAMISYSTGKSGTGADVEKVRKATAIAKQKQPDLLIDGPLQYDAAAVKAIASSKAPDSPVAGNASVFVFPDLNTGNTTYKAVQRSANAISIGPMLQGLRKPVNDLSRGAEIDDIVYTIALTVVQGQES